MTTGNSHCMITDGTTNIRPRSRRPPRPAPPRHRILDLLLLGRSMLSGAGRNRRSSAKTVSATMPRTVISPRVSKPRKSTRITLTTLRPPPSL